MDTISSDELLLIILFFLVTSLILGIKFRKNGGLQLFFGADLILFGIGFILFCLFHDRNADTAFLLPGVLMTIFGVILCVLGIMKNIRNAKIEKAIQHGK